MSSERSQHFITKSSVDKVFFLTDEYVHNIQIIEENEAFLKAVIENQRKGNIAAASEFQKRLHRNILTLLEAYGKNKDIK